MTGLLGITQVLVPQEKAEEAHAYLRKIGFQGAEAVALWAGVAKGTTFEVRETIIPKQKAHRSDTGIYFTVSSDELHRINVWLYENGMQIIAQLHSHPQDAYHSELDDELPIATRAGCLSLVIPDFARDPFSLKRCATYRLIPERGWTALAPSEVSRLIKIVGDSRIQPSPSTPSQAAPKDLWHWLRSFKKPR